MRDLSTIIEVNDEAARERALTSLGDAAVTFRPVGVVEFMQARDAVPNRRAFLTPHGYGTLLYGATYLSDDNRVGYAILDGGELVNVFNNGGPKGAGRLAVRDAVRNGARKLDAFDGFLVRFYTELGFVEVGRAPFDHSLAPDGWDYTRDGLPDVVFMELAK